MGQGAERIRVIIYDLDGTVYDDNRHFEIYARLIQETLPGAVQEDFWADYRAVVDGRHPALAIGRFFDRERDLVLKPRGGRIAAALRWDGSAISPEQVAQWYPDEVKPDHSRILNVGDLWWAPTAVAGHYGGDAAKNQKCFLQIREMMADPSFTIKPIPGFRELVQELKGEVLQVLVTNSPQPDSEAILTKVGLIGLMDRCYFQSNKPAGLGSIIAELARDNGGSTEGLLSIGDNLVNEIAPAKALGCRTVFIDPHSLAEPGDADLIVRNMAELMPWLRRMILA